MSAMGHSRRSDGGPAASGLPRSTDILKVCRHVSKVPQPDSCAAANWRPHRLANGCDGLHLARLGDCLHEAFAISGSAAAAPAAVKAAQSSAVMLASRLTINVTRQESTLRMETDTSKMCLRRTLSENATRARCGFDKMEMRVEQPPYQGAALAGTIELGDLTVNRLGFGAMRLCGDAVWGRPRDRGHSNRVLHRAVELGVNFIDTADSYGRGANESQILILKRRCRARSKIPQ
jgi:hypothetical protein